MTLDYQSLLDPAIAIAREAGALVMEYYHNGAEEMVKSDSSPVTEADLASDRLITEKLSELTPDIPIVTEEGVEAGAIPDVSSGRYWVCDPIDGTIAFIKRRDSFCILISLIDNFQPVIGVAHYPALHETFYAIKGQGAHRINHRNNTTKKVQTNPPGNDFPLVASNPQLNDVNKLRSLFSHIPEHYYRFSDEHHLHDLLDGHTDMQVLISRSGGEWDLATFKLLLDEAGGSVVWLEEEFCFGNPVQKLVPMVFLARKETARFLPKTKAA